MIFLDSSYLIALFRNQDQWHEQAINLYGEIAKEKLTISKLVLAETITLLRLNLTAKEIKEIYINLINDLNVINETNYYGNAINTFVKYDASISFFDAMYIYIMEKHNIDTIVSFDSDFDKVKGIIRKH